uniref:Ig-like domain-containing protein n=1 Tax=Crocodylus porosus TaxID=8502 RepID=A0A7M4F461_CROPO
FPSTWSPIRQEGLRLYRAPYSPFAREAPAKVLISSPLDSRASPCLYIHFDDNVYILVSNYIFFSGSVSVYVLINSKDLILKCLTKKLLMQRIIDPKYQWIGPMGLITKESQRFLLTDEGNLEVYNIHASDSGSYTCSVIYMHNDRHVIAEFKTCETSAVVPFEKQLLEHLEKLMRNLQCEIQQWNTQCHAATDTVAMLTHKLIFQFVGKINICLSIEYQQIHYISGSLSGIKMDHCKPGFGKNINNSTMCPGCCGKCAGFVCKQIRKYLSQKNCNSFVLTLSPIIYKCKYLDNWHYVSVYQTARQ